jgi:putative ABC transport system substrate-binding protein
MTDLRRREFILALGGAVVWPLAVSAQHARKIPTIGVLWHAGSAEEEAPYLKALRQGFNDLGYVEGQSIILEHRFLRKFRSDLLASPPSLLRST